MMQRYEALVLTVPEITNDELRQMESQLDRLVTDSKGATLSFERWGKFKLTYPVLGNEYGVYCLMRFEAPADLVIKMRDFFAVKLHNISMRHIIARVESDSLVYQRPKSLEEASTSRDVDTFLKENQMGGLLSSMGEKGKETKDEYASDLSSPEMEEELEATALEMEHEDVEEIEETEAPTEE
jgi:small subunit ribosomal protein S6